MLRISKRTQTVLKHAFYVICNNFVQYFQDLIFQTEGVRPKEITFQSIDDIGRIGRNKRLHLVEIAFSSEYGFHKAKLAIKVYDDEKAIQEATGSAYLADWLKKEKGIKTPKLLYYSKDHKILIYEGLYAKNFDDADIEINEKHFLSGIGLATVHGYELKEIDLQRYYLLVEKGLKEIEKLEIPKSHIQNLSNILYFEIENVLYHSFGGARAFGDFHPGYIMFQIEPHPIHHYGRSSDNVEVFLIDAEFLETKETNENFDRIDRFEDCGTFYAKILLEEFVKSAGSINKTLKNMKNMFEGYDTTFFKQTKVHFWDLYPKGTSLEFQTSLSLLFDTLYISRLEGDYGKEWVKSAIDVRMKLIDFLFTNRPLKTLIGI